jgi:general stress protein 26
MADEQEKVHDILKDYDNVMLVTHGRDGRLDARPMHVAELETSCDMYFLTRVDDKVQELERNPNAQVVAQQEKESWVSLSGRVEVLNDRSRVDRLWAEPYRAWFPDGREDPNLRVLAFRADRGEYWDLRGTNKAKYGFKVAKAYVTGDPPTPDAGEHGATRL